MAPRNTVSPDAILLRRREVCELIGITPRTVTRWAHLGILQPVRIGGTTRYRRADVEALAARENESEARAGNTGPAKLGAGAAGHDAGI